MSAPSTVYLVGAGPGDPGLLTLRAAELLAAADVLVYDYLASDAVLALGNPQAERHFVGKKGFTDHVTQDQINALLVELGSHAGTSIVRVKGGDPFVFGRGGEEALALAEAGIPFEVVPGVTAGVAASAYAGIPVTHRGVSSQVTLVTGHETPDKPDAAIDWEALAKSGGTVCFYMGIRELPLIVSRLIEAGRAPDTPVALVRWGTTPDQETLTGTLATIARLADEANFQAPAIIVVGEVVTLREQLRWFEDRPLFGRRIVVTRSREQASALSELLIAAGASVQETSAIAIKPRELEPQVQETIRRLAAGETYDWCVFTSANGVSCFFELLDACRFDARAFARCRVAAIGPATADALLARGIRADLVPPRFVAESVAEALENAGVGSGSRVLIPRAAAARDALPNLLVAAGAQADVLPVYDTLIPDDPAASAALVEQLREGRIDAVTFTSSSTARNFAAQVESVMPGELSALLENVVCASIGPITSAACAEVGIPVTVEASTYTIPALAECLKQALSRVPSPEQDKQFEQGASR